MCAGIGYGSFIMAKSGLHVISVEKDPEAVDYGEQHFRHPELIRVVSDIHEFEFDASPVVAFECIEHLANPLQVLKRCGDIIACSVPNESVVPYNENNKYHYRHYTKQQFCELLESAGYRDIQLYGQKDIFSDVEKDIDGQTLIALGSR